MRTTAACKPRDESSAHLIEADIVKRTAQEAGSHTKHRLLALVRRTLAFFGILLGAQAIEDPLVSPRYRRWRSSKTTAAPFPVVALPGLPPARVDSS